MPPLWRKGELPFGCWFTMQARIRPLEPHEQPPGVVAYDQRMVEFYGESEEMIVPNWSGFSFPMGEPQLAADFMRIFAGDALPSDEQVIGFYQRHGPLREQVQVGAETIPVWVLRLAPEGQRALKRKPEVFFCEPLWWVRERAQEIKTVHTLYRALKEDDMAALKAVFPRVPAGREIVAIELLRGKVSLSFETPTSEAGGRRPSSSVRRVTEAETRRWGNLLLARQLEFGERESARHWTVPDSVLRPRLHPARAGEEGSPVKVQLSRSFSSLTGAMYCALGAMVEQGLVMRQCPQCDALFYPTHGNQHFCRTECGNVHRQRRFTREHPGRKRLRNKRTTRPASRHSLSPADPIAPGAAGV